MPLKDQLSKRNLEKMNQVSNLIYLLEKILDVPWLLDIDFILSPSETDTPGDGNCFIHAILDQLKYDTIWKKRKSHRLSFKRNVHK